MIVTPNVTYQPPVQEPARVQNAPLPQEHLRVVETSEKGEAAARGALRQNESDNRHEIQARQRQEEEESREAGAETRAADEAADKAGNQRSYGARSSNYPLGSQLDVYA